jgi:GT2 family glycosyltransferase
MGKEPNPTLASGSPRAAPEPTCSVVIAAYNEASTIAGSLASVLAQTREDLEVIVVDQGSTDNTLAVVSEYAVDHRVRLRRQSNSGRAGARNVGIALARGRYVSMLESDDLWLPRYLELMVDALESTPDAALAYTRAWILDRATNRVRRATWPAQLPNVPERDSEALLRGLTAGTFVCASATVRREALRQVGRYEPGVAPAEDYDLWLRIAARGHGAIPLDGPLLICSVRTGSRSNDDETMRAGIKLAYQRLLTGNSLSRQSRRLAERALAKTERRLARLARNRRSAAIGGVSRPPAIATRSLRYRATRRRSPPPEIALSFPAIGDGKSNGASAEWVPISSRRRAAATKARTAATAKARAAATAKARAAAAAKARTVAAAKARTSARR